MNRRVARAKNLIFRSHNPQFDVFINHRGVGTRQNFAGLLHYHLTLRNFHPFLDYKSMKPGDKLFDKIDEAICMCKVGVVIFSPHYYESPFCLHELALLTEINKRVLLIFWNVKPAQLQVMDNANCSSKDLQRFRFALDKIKDTVGLTFNISKRDWSKLIKDNSDAVIQSLTEVEAKEQPKVH